MKAEILSVPVAVVVLLQVANFVEGQTCDIYSGPPGQAECVCGLEGYQGCQWATCLTNSYIQQKSRNRHECDFRGVLFGVYCWYQCQIEEFNLEEGPVYDKCKCTSGQSAPTPAPPPPGGNDGALDESCFSPDGTKCNWYRTCLEKKYPCEASGNGYALSYAEKFCNLYTTRSSYFTPLGREWIDAVRKCLQVALVPLIRSYRSATCDEVKQTAFDSHTPCYLEPFPGKPSICDLNCQDWAQVFWTIKSGFTDAFVESLKGTVQVMLGCGKKFSLLSSGCPSVIVKLTVVYVALRGKRQVQDQNARDEIAGDVTEELAKRLKWDPDVMDWFGYASNITEGSGDPNKIDINVLLGDKIQLGLTSQTTSNRVPQFSLESVVRDFSEVLKEGWLYDMQVYGGKASVSSMKGCMDFQCDQIFQETTAGPPAVPTPDPKGFAPRLPCFTFGTAALIALASTLALRNLFY